MKRFLTAITLSLAAAATFAQPMPPAPQPMETITVSGSGRATVTPDRFRFTAGVQTVGPQLDDALNQNNARVAAVVAALKKAGATDAEIRTSNFSIFPQQDYQQGKAPRITGYQVSNTVTVTKSAIADASRLITVAVNSGVNQTSGIEFLVNDPARGRDAGLRAAYDDARAKAALLAQAAGRTLGRTLSISEGVVNEPPRPYPQPQAMRMAKSEISDVPVESGTQDVSFEVTVVFELR